MQIRALKNFNDRKADPIVMRKKDDEFYVEESWGSHLIAQGYAEEVDRRRDYTDEQKDGGRW